MRWGLLIIPGFLSAQFKARARPGFYIDIRPAIYMRTHFPGISSGLEFAAALPAERKNKDMLRAVAGSRIGILSRAQRQFRDDKRGLTAAAALSNVPELSGGTQPRSAGDVSERRHNILG
jgi:hypothetical protein